MLTAISATASRRAIGALRAAPIRRASRLTGAGPLSSLAITANSSPPRRATKSLRRMVCRSRSETSSSVASPAGWPWRSLIALKPSRSSASTASGMPGPLRAGDGALERLGQGAAVGQPGQGIVQRQVRQADLGLLARGDVGGDADDLQRPAVGPALRHLRVLLDPGIAAVPAAHRGTRPGPGCGAPRRHWANMARTRPRSRGWTRSSTSPSAQSRRCGSRPSRDRHKPS